MNIFKVGLFLCILLFNLSCSIVPDEVELPNENVMEMEYLINEKDLNVDEGSFIEIQGNERQEINLLVDFLDGRKLFNLSAIEALDELPQELNFTPYQLNKIEESVDHYQSSTIEKKFLLSLIELLRKSN